MKHRLQLMLALLCVCIPGYAQYQRAFVYQYGPDNRNYGYFINTAGDVWDEYNCEKKDKIFSFKFVRQSGTAKILYDPKRNLYIKLTGSQVYLGYTQNKIDEFFYNGWWSYSIEELDTFLDHKNIFNYSTALDDRCLVRDEANRFLEIIKERKIVFAQGDIIRESPERILMYRRERAEFVKLSAEALYTSKKEDGVFVKQHNGAWSRGHLEYDAANVIRTVIQDSMDQWHQKGEFETSADFTARVTEENRRKKAQELARTVMVRVIADYKKAFDCRSLGLGFYNTDKAAFEVDYNFSTYWLPVPLAEAPDFKKTWDKVRVKDEDFWFKDNKLMLKAFTITNPATGKTYTYKGDEKEAAAEQMQFEFQPIEVNVHPNDTGAVK